MLDSFIKWMGGKSRLRKEIIPLIPPHKTYVESFGGAGWILFGKPPSPVEFINDLDQSLINLYLVVRDNLNEFLEYLNNIPISEILFENTLNDIKPGSARYTKEVHGGIPSVAQAVKFYYIVTNAFNGKIAEKPSFAIDSDRESAFVKFYSTNWQQIQDRLKRVTILCRDFGDIITTLDSPKTFFYLDPPYICATDNTRYYRYTFTTKDHSRLLVYLCELKGKFLLSYGDVPEIRNSYSDFNIIESIRVPGELFILNYEPPKIPFYSTCSKGIPIIPEGLVYQGSRQRASWQEPNCPECGSRFVKRLYERVTLEKGSRNWISNGYTCKRCDAIFKFPVDQHGIPNGV